MDGTADLAVLFSLLLTDFVAALVLRAVPTEVTETTVVEQGPTRASVDAGLDIAGVVVTDADVELRPREYDETGASAVGSTDWRVWDVEFDL